MQQNLLLAGRNYYCILSGGISPFTLDRGDHGNLINLDL
jgi:hypothetical protein